VPARRWKRPNGRDDLIAAARSILYLSCVAAVAGGALLFLAREILPLPYVPVVGRFMEPASTLLEFLWFRGVGARFEIWHAERALSFLVSASIALLTVRRVMIMRAARSLSPPRSFAGFPHGLMWGVLVLFPLSDVLARPERLMVVFVTLAFFATELADLRGKPPDPMPARRRPVFGVLSIVLPLIGAACMALLVARAKAQGGGLDALVQGGMAIAVCSAFGLAAALAAIFRKERWIALQVIGFITDFTLAATFGPGMVADLLRA
jgi:hypothetical protein